MNPAVNTVGSLIEHESKDFAGLIGYFTHMSCSGCCNSCRLFTKNMLSVFHGCNGQAFMAVVRDTDQNCVTTAFTDQFFSAFIYFCRISHVFPEPYPSAFAQVSTGCNFNLRTFSGSNIPAVLTAHVTDSDYPQPDLLLFHFLHFHLRFDYPIRTASAWAFRHNSAALKACSWVIAFSVRFRQSRISSPKNGYPVTPDAFRYCSPFPLTT